MSGELLKLVEQADRAELAQVAKLLGPHLGEPDGERLYTSHQAAAYMQCRAGVDRIYDLVRLGKLTPERDGRTLLFRRRELDRHLRDN